MREMGLIEISGVVNNIEYRRTLAQKVNSMARAFDLAELRVTHADRAQKASLNRAAVACADIIVHRILHGRLHSDDSAPYETIHKDLRVVVGGQFPRVIGEAES